MDVASKMCDFGLESTCSEFEAGTHHVPSSTSFQHRNDNGGIVPSNFVTLNNSVSKKGSG